MSKTLKIIKIIVTVASVVTLTMFAVNIYQDRYKEIENLKK